MALYESTCQHKNLFTGLFVIARRYEQPKYLSVDKWINAVSPYNGILLSI